MDSVEIIGRNYEKLIHNTGTARRRRIVSTATDSVLLLSYYEKKN